MSHYSDQKVKRYRGGGSSFNYNAYENRRSKAWLDKVKRQLDPVKYIESLDGGQAESLYNDTRKDRYGNTDWNRIKGIVGDGPMSALKERASESKAARNADSQKRHESYARQVQAQREELVADARLSAGYVQSEIATAIKYREKHGLHDGDWLEDPVAALTGQGGFGEEIQYSTGIKVQVHICLDCSNSMYHNGLSDIAVETVRTLYLALKMASEQLPAGSLVVHLWKWAMEEDGKCVDHLSDPNVYRWTRDEDNPLGDTQWLPNHQGQWTGEDTWLYPLLEKLEDWENREGDPGAYRLDLIISDGVLEHKTDAGRGDAIQERRDGHLQSVIFNFLPVDSWGDYRVPNRCVQYPVTVETLGGTLRSVFGEWISFIM